MAGNVYLRTNKFEVKLEGITFKTKDFESLCSMDFLFLDGKVWDCPPIIGLDVMRHPRDPSSLLVLLCFGVGCVILRFQAGEALPAPIHNFFADKRVHFVGFGIPEKKDLFPFKELGLTKTKVDIGYLAAKILKDTKYKRAELPELARKVLGIKRMIGITEVSSFERQHEQIKCAICQLFITSVIATELLHADEKKKWDRSPKGKSFLNSLHVLAEVWFKTPKDRKKNRKIPVLEDQYSVRVHIGETEDMLRDDFLANPEFRQDPSKDDSSDTTVKVNPHAQNAVGLDDHVEEVADANKKPLKGILKCPSSGLKNCKLPPSQTQSHPTEQDQMAARGILKRANSKGCNVSFKS